MSNQQTTSRPPFIARAVYLLSVPIIVGWLAITAFLFFGIPSLEQVGKERSVSQVPEDAPSYQAMRHMGEVFKESDSDSFAMVVLEGQQPLGPDAHAYYDELIRQLQGRHEACEPRAGFLGGSAHGAGCGERRRQGHVCPGESRG